VPSSPTPARRAVRLSSRSTSTARTLSAGLDLFPGGHFIPYLDFDHNAGSGSGCRDWVQDSNNEYAVPTCSPTAQRTIAAACASSYSRFHLTLEQGGNKTYKDNDQATDATLLGGDNPRPFSARRSA